MCGIAGWAGLSLRGDEAEQRLSDMCGVIRHRGPDGEGRLLLPHVALGMRRLSIIDVTGGWQPIANEDSTVQVVFNGEIYNHRELRRELELRGHVFRTHSDTETIVHGYEEWGDAVVEHLRGMFGIALWDVPRSRLLLARDRLGIKPLYVWPHDGGIAFASELKSLQQLPNFPTTVSRDALLRYLALGYVPDPLSIFPGISKLEPGHRLAWTAAGITDSTYWSPTARPIHDISEDEAVAELRRQLEDAVSCHLESEVPLGAFLSGGVDSSTVVAQMARLLSRPVKTFAIGFDSKTHNEAPDARRVADAIGTEHTELIVRPEADGLIDELLLGFDEPFADSSALPTFLVSQLARQHVTVSLSGDGGDELFGGYTRYDTALKVPQPGAVARAVAHGVASRLPMGAYGRNYLLNVARTRRGQYASTVALPLPVEEGGVVRTEVMQRAVSLDALMSPWFDSTADADFPAQMMQVDLQSYLPGDILTKVDRMSMRVSLEARVPLLDHHFVEFALSLPSRFKLRDGTGKWIFRKAIEGLVPPVVLQKKKQGFAVPLHDWFRGPLRYRLEEIDAEGRLFDVVDRHAYRRLVAEHLSGRRDHSEMLWRLMVLHTWLGARAHA